MVCCGSRPSQTAAANARHGLQRSRPPAGVSPEQHFMPTLQQRPVATGTSDAGASTDDSGSEADSFYSADDVFYTSSAAGLERECESGGDLSNVAEDEVERVQALLSSMTGATVEAEGWERAATWSSDAGTACAYRKPASDDTGVFILFFEAYFSAISPVSIFRVQTDLNFRPKWDSNCVEVSQIGFHDGHEIVYWEVKYPWPLSNRDYVYARKSHASTSGSYVLVQRACQPGEHQAEKNGVVRVLTYTSDALITPAPGGGCKMKIIYQDDPRGRIPKSVVNWASTKAFGTGMADFARAGAMLEHERG